ncbi:MAG: peptidoglycan-binding protein LysM [Hellea sp.]|nr:peptidoglycan-binding protein LysM [Hyphomonadaceae bacterium]NNE57706.1 peptidoglycan-binding protein LysM [Hellea sp.]
MFGNIPFVKVAGRGIKQVLGVKETKEKIEKEIDDLGLEKDGVEIDVDADGKVKVAGKASSQEAKEKILLAVGNIFGVAEVKDDVETEDETENSQLHTVVSGDTLWKIAKKYYGKGSRYPEIFEANRPMLSHPDKIYVGQVLRIPADNTETKTAMV